jgi:hypothetical protein
MPRIKWPRVEFDYGEDWGAFIAKKKEETEREGHYFGIASVETGGPDTPTVVIFEEELATYDNLSQQKERDGRRVSDPFPVWHGKRRRKTLR